MIKLKVNEVFGLPVTWELYVVDFYRGDGQTKAIVLNEDGVLEDYLIEDLKIDYCDFIVGNKN